MSKTECAGLRCAKCDYFIDSPADRAADKCWNCGTPTPTPVRLAQLIQNAIAVTRDRSPQRRAALAEIRWALKSELGFLFWEPTIVASSWRWVEDINAATIYDGRDNEELKRSFAEAVTGEALTIELA